MLERDTEVHATYNTHQLFLWGGIVVARSELFLGTGSYNQVPVFPDLKTIFRSVLESMMTSLVKLEVFCKESIQQALMYLREYDD